MGKLLALCLGALALLTGCSRLALQGEVVKATPSLELLSMPAYQEKSAPDASPAEAQEPLRVDLWLDASQVMGGVNEHEESLYPHSGWKYRQGGFHYRFGDETGWYENVLEAMLEAAEGVKTRVLRAGAERIPDELLRRYGMDGDEEELRSFRRDLLTYAVDPAPDVFSSFTTEKMDDSFYALGSPMLNQMERFMENGGALLENPGRVESMNALLTELVSAFHQKKQEPPEEWNAAEKDDDNPLFYALDNLDENRLSVIVCDPAALRRLQGIQADGTSVKYLEEILRKRGVFDRGLTAGLYAMQLDYMGQMTSFGAADFAEPLIWGRLNYIQGKKADRATPMPRILLVLVVGTKERVRQYTGSLNALLDGDETLQELRGPDKGQLVYTRNGETVTQEPFGFFYEYAEILRPSLGAYGQEATLQTDDGEIVMKDGYSTVRLTGREGKALLELHWPVQTTEGIDGLDVASLTGGEARVAQALLLAQTAPNTPENGEEAGENDQTLTFRETRYTFSMRQDPFAAQPEESPFLFRGFRWSEDGTELLATIEVDKNKLKSGYYRVEVEASAGERQVSLEKVEWAQNNGGLSVEISSREIVAWETFSQYVKKTGARLQNVPRQLDHAWGSAENGSYRGEPVPDFPPVYRAPHLQQLLEQLRDAAGVESVPFARCVFDAFVSDMD